MDKKYSIFKHKNTKQNYAVLTENIIEIEFKAKEFLWNLPKETIIECFVIVDDKITSQKYNFELQELHLTMSMKFKDLEEIFYIKN